MGLFGNNRKKSLWDTINGLQDDTYAPSNPTAEAMARPVADYQSDPSIGDVSGAPKKGFNWGRAALGFFGGPGVAQLFHEKDAKDEQENALRQLGYGDADIKALRNSPAALSQVLADRYDRPKALPPNDTERDAELFGRELGPEARKSYLHSRAYPDHYLEVDDGQGGKRIINMGGGGQGGAPGGSSPPPPQAIARLLQNPGEAGLFASKYGQEAADAILNQGGAGSQAPRNFRSPTLFGRRY